MQAKRNPNAVE